MKFLELHAARISRKSGMVGEKTVDSSWPDPAAKDITGLCPVIAVRDGGVRLHSRLWHRWSLVLRGDGRQELLGG